MSSSEAKPVIYFVDDEPDILAGLRQTLRKERKRWDMHFLVGAEAGLAAMRVAPPDVVISDMRMPRMDGATLLEQVKAQYPESLRFVLSGEASESLSLRAVPLAHQWMSKPCSRGTLVASIERALKVMRHLRSPSLRAWVAANEGLPSAPHAFHGVQKALQDREADMGTVARWIEQDPGLAARVLQITNSSFFGPRQTIVRVRDAVTMIGLRLLGQIVLAAEIVQVFGKASKEVTRILRHAQQVAGLAQSMAVELEMDPNHALTAGLLHDVGAMLMAQHPEASTAKSISIEDQAAVGGALLQSWGLPLEIVATASFFHQPSALPSEGVSVVGIVHIADAIVQGQDPEADYVQAHGLEAFVERWRENWQSQPPREAA